MGGIVKTYPLLPAVIFRGWCECTKKKLFILFFRSQCFVRGAGGNVYTLRIPGPGSYVDCGTERVSERSKRILSKDIVFHCISVLYEITKQETRFKMVSASTLKEFFLKISPQKHLWMQICINIFVKFRDTMTNIVVVQFVSSIQTSMDIKYNLTCVTRGPGSAVVTSGVIGAGYRIVWPRTLWTRRYYLLLISWHFPFIEFCLHLWFTPDVCMLQVS